jgi:hypothetical protein
LWWHRMVEKDSERSMNDIIAHLKNASRACTDGYECSLSIREVRHVVALLAEKDAEIARLREDLRKASHGDSCLCAECFKPDAPLSPAPEVERFVKALESAPK